MKSAKRLAESLRVTKWAMIALMVCGIITLTFILQPFSHNPMKLVYTVKAFSRSFPYPFIFFIFFIAVGSLALLPLNILLIAAALIFPGWKGFFCGLLGALLTTAIEYMIGRTLVSPEFLEQKSGEKVRLIKEKIAKNGLAAMTFLSLVPVAPHIVNNLVAGVCRLALKDVLLGTAIGVTPGLLLMNVFGRSVRHFIRHPNWFTASLVIAVLVAMVLFMRFIRGHFLRKHQNDELPSVP